MMEPQRDGEPCAPQSEDELEKALRQMEEAGFSRLAVAAAVRRAKQKTTIVKSKAPAARPKLATDPDLDAWFD